MYIVKDGIINGFIQPNRCQYTIPVYQRNYEWPTEECQKLFEDVITAHLEDRMHFCGSIIYALLRNENKINYYVIIDGQQRITTIYLLIKALIDVADDDSDKAILKEVLFNVDKFQKYNIDDSSKLKLKPIRTDNNQLLLLMENRYDEMDKSSGIYKNYQLFCNLASVFLKEHPDMSVSNIYDGLEHLTCASIKLEDEDDNAQEIFERINSTGVPLSLADKIRNFVLMTDEDQDKLFEDYWLYIEQALDKRQLADFFVDYLNMKQDGFAKADTAYEDFKYIFRSRKYTNEGMLQEIVHYVRQYHWFLNGSGDLSPEVNEALGNFRKLKQTTIFLFLFRVFDDYEDGVIDSDVLAKVLNLFLNYTIRRMMCEIGSNSLNGLYKTLYDHIFVDVEYKNNYYDSIVSYMLQFTNKNAIPSDSEFKTALTSNNLYGKKPLCKFLLTAVENQGKTKVMVDNLTIEHIMPQNKNISLAWQKMLGEDWMLVKDRYLHTLGNLTLTGYNSELGDKPFEEKLKLLDKSETHITLLNSDVTSCDSWTENTITNRANRLADEIIRLFPIIHPACYISFSESEYSEYTTENPQIATNKLINYYEFLGERVSVNSFSEMVRSVCRTLYYLDKSIIEGIIADGFVSENWTRKVFSYNANDITESVKISDDGDVYMMYGGLSASDSVRLIRELLKRYDMDVEEDLIYSACDADADSVDYKARYEIAKQWCESKLENGRILFDRKNCSSKLIRFTTERMNSIIPESNVKPSPWNTPNYYFYEINHSNGLMFIQLYFYCSDITDNMKNAFTKLFDIVNKGGFVKSYKLVFKSSEFPVSRMDNSNIITRQLDSLLSEVEAFESDVIGKWYV